LYGRVILKDDSFISIVGALSGVFGGMRFMWAPIVNKLSYKVVFGGILLTNTIIGFSFINIVPYKPLYLMYVCTAFWFAGGQFAIFPVIITKNFGAQAVMVYSIGLSFCGISQLVSSILVDGFLEYLGYRFFYYLGGGLNALSFLLLLFLFKDEKMAV
jgi:hypothetical protein